MENNTAAAALGKKRAQNLRKKLGSKALKNHMCKVRAGEKLS